MKRQGAHISLHAHTLALIRLWNWRLYVYCAWRSYNTLWIPFLSATARRPAGTTGKPWCLSTSCIFITVKPPSKLTASRMAVCAAGSAVSMRTQKKIRERNWWQHMSPGGWEIKSQTCLSESGTEVNTMTATGSVAADKLLIWFPSVLSWSFVWAPCLKIATDWRLLGLSHWPGDRDREIGAEKISNVSGITYFCAEHSILVIQMKQWYQTLYGLRFLRQYDGIFTIANAG